MSEDELNGSLIEKFFEIHGYYQIWTDRCIITINAPFTLEYKGIVKYEDIKLFISENRRIFVGSKIERCVIEDGKEFSITLSNKIKIIVSLEEAKYRITEPVYIKFYKDDKMIIF